MDNPNQPPKSSGSASDSLEVRLRRVEDYQAVLQLVAEYVSAVDGGDWALYANLFAVEGELVFQDHQIKGRAAIRKAMEGMMSRTAGRPASGGLRHTITNVDIRLDGDRATTEARWTTISKGPDDRPLHAATGRCLDTMIREHGEWKFLRCVRTNDFPPVPGSPTSR